MCGPSYAGISIYMYQCFLIGIIFLVLHIGYDKLHHDLSIVQGKLYEITFKIWSKLCL